MLLLVLLFLGFDVAVSSYRSRGEPWALGFVLFSYLDLILLLFSLRRFEQLGGGDDDSPEEEKKKKARLKMAIWLLSSALILGFGWRVSQMMPSAVAAAVWVMGGSVVAGGFAAHFLY